MKRWTRFAGILGLVLLAFGVLALYVFGNAFESFYILLHLAFGAILILIWALTAGAITVSQANQIVRGRLVRFGVSAVLYSALFAILVVSINYIANRNNKRWDFTDEKVYSLSDQTTQIVSGLKKPLKIVVLDTPTADGGNLRIDDLLALYKDRNTSLVTTEVVNPRANPQLIKQYGFTNDNFVYLEYGEGDTKAISRINQSTEEAITTAILKLTGGAEKKIYFLEGHGEPDLNDPGERGLKLFADAAKDERLTVEKVVLGTKGQVPDDAAAVVLAAPQTQLLPGERESLISYVEKGGRLLLLTNPREGGDVRAIAKHFGITIGDDVVIDIVQRLLMGPALATEFISNSFGPHDITKHQGDQDVFVANMASSVVKSPEASDGTYTEIVKTSANGWAETNLAGIFDADEPTATPDDADRKGPVAIALAFEKALGQTKEGETAKKQRVVVFGDSDWLSNKYFAYSSHKDVALNTLNWLAGQEVGISIRPKSMRGTLTPMTEDVFRALLYSGFWVPEIVLIMGLLVWWRRRTTVYA